MLLCVACVADLLAACGGVDVSSSTPQGSMASPNGSSRVEPSYARADVEPELATAPVLPGATETGRSPTPALDDTPQRDLQVDLNRWWTAPGIRCPRTAVSEGSPAVRGRGRRHRNAHPARTAIRLQHHVRARGGGPSDARDRPDRVQGRRGCPRQRPGQRISQLTDPNPYDSQRPRSNVRAHVPFEGGSIRHCARAVRQDCHMRTVTLPCWMALTRSTNRN